MWVYCRPQGLSLLPLNLVDGPEMSLARGGTSPKLEGGRFAALASIETPARECMATHPTF